MFAFRYRHPAKQVPSTHTHIYTRMINSPAVLSACNYTVV